MITTKKFALVTGGTSGIGLELAKLLGADGYNLVIIARDKQELDQVSSELTTQYPIEVLTIQKDLSDNEAPHEIFEALKAKGITIDILINNAGQGVYGEFMDTDLERELAIIRLNINACIMLTKFFLKDMIAFNTGRILNVSSIAGKVPGPYQAVYHGTKAFVHFFSEAVRNELRKTNVTITSLLPGATDTDFFNKADMEAAKIVQEGDLANPADVAKDGYDAMMAGKDMVVSGFKNKVQIAMSNVTPDSKATDNMRKQQEPVNKS
ncbi:SDR family NAD(P)-dependent oxidoreductase [Parapedobacter pyrenivorans]|uniref:SDR family NAD(P)-dependent oxidoreductase n=1 Tax=Parapedobacter pyrenivorans TaxID=1305674 RepID=UPI0033427123